MRACGVAGLRWFPSWNQVGPSSIGAKGVHRLVRAAAPAAGSGGNGCTIKGNINSKGEKIYHVDGKSPSYDDTVVDESAGERWFCSESEARRPAGEPRKTPADRRSRPPG